ncbi:MAG: ATP-binding cassette domain-containing protein [Bacteroidales bacterium]
MSEEILKALMELFALIVKQDKGILADERDYVFNFLSKQLTSEAVSEYIALFDFHAGPVTGDEVKAEHSAPSVKDSVKILGICKKINRTLNQEQKVVVLMRLYELVNAKRQFTPQRMNIINTVAEVFRIAQDEVNAIEQFIRNDSPDKLVNGSIIVLQPGLESCDICDRMITGYAETTIIVLRVISVDLYFLRYISHDQLYLNGLPISAHQVYTFAKGGSVKTQQGHPIYYSDISSTFLSDKNIPPLSLHVENVTYSFGDGNTAVNNVSFSVEEGALVGILGASGSGKTTLLNLMCGIEKPTSGTVRINGIDLSASSRAMEGVLGYVPQDDLLIEDLTVFENLYYAAKQCFGNSSPAEIKKITLQTLSNLGLLEKRDLKVGSPLNKVISGGQRKRLNIALELIREPSILFLDEPTSGLSSRDSENLMDLLRDLTLKGKLIITVIHQPSSEVFKMFDKVIILDQGGHMAYFGNPVESVIYFKTLDVQINSSIGECPSCGNVNPETIFNIMETQVVDEFGRYTEKRKIKPAEWASRFAERHPYTPVSVVTQPPHKNLQRPSLLNQFYIFLSRDFKSKIANRQYVLLTVLEAPILGFILSFIIRYIPDPSSDKYIFFENENIPIYIFMSLIVALFLGLTISAEEIFRDRKILKREHFLSLSRGSYLFSKVAILIGISALQVFLFLVIANPILELKGLFFRYFVALFATAFCANTLGLNISASFNSAITIYIVIPLVIIPMMVLSGAMFSFDKLNRTIGSVDKVPLIAEIMPTRWTYEALMVSQFKDNEYNQFRDSRFGKTVYEYKKNQSIANYYSVKLMPSLNSALERADSLYRQIQNSRANPGIAPRVDFLKDNGDLKLLQNELRSLARRFPSLEPFRRISELTPENFNETVYTDLKKYLSFVESSFNRIENRVNEEWDEFYLANKQEIKKLENEYGNIKLQEIVTKFYERDKTRILEYKNSLVQNYDPVYLEPEKKGPLAFRTHFFAPSKYFFGTNIDTFYFNITVVFAGSLMWLIILYFELLGRLVRLIENVRFRK